MPLSSTGSPIRTMRHRTQHRCEFCEPHPSRQETKPVFVAQLFGFTPPDHEDLAQWLDHTSKIFTYDIAPRCEHKLTRASIWPKDYVLSTMDQPLQCLFEGWISQFHFDMQHLEPQWIMHPDENFRVPSEVTSSPSGGADLEAGATHGTPQPLTDHSRHAAMHRQAGVLKRIGWV
jgi:hypothetical protein